MSLDRRGLVLLRWLCLLVILFAFVHTQLGVYQTASERSWSLLSNRTDNLARLMEAVQRHAFLILNAGLVWVLALIAERLVRPVQVSSVSSEFEQE